MPMHASRFLSWLAASLVVALGAAPALAASETCPGHPNAIGTSRTIVVDPTEHAHVGTMQYAETLPLRDHEVVLTFDDGPLPRYSSQVLDILAAQCVKATFFEIGKMAQAFPDGIKRLRAEGHTIGTHSQDHPLSFERMPLDKVAKEVDDGIASVKAALGDDSKDLSPFFRIPGLLRSPQVDQLLAARGLMTWSADFLADDWRSVSSARVAALALSRLEAKGKGILLLHDIHARTVAALPTMLRQLKAHGYRVVHVVPVSAEQAKTQTVAADWRLRGESEIAATKWPAVPHFVFAETAASASPDVADLGVTNPAGALIAVLKDLPRLRTRTPLPPEFIWPRQLSALPAALVASLPVPSAQLFHPGYGPFEGGFAPHHPDTTHRAEATAPAAD
jgi:peptidoglycan/xylan/chitin deacetylase (PgdA/CDA1 family)